MLWKLETLETVSTKEEHTMIITDIRFRPNSMQLATSSFDGTVRLWNAAEVCFLQSLHLILLCKITWSEDEHVTAIRTKDNI